MEEEMETGRLSNLSRMTQLKRETARQSGSRGCPLGHHTILQALSGMLTQRAPGKRKVLGSFSVENQEKTTFTPPGFIY